MKPDDLPKLSIEVKRLVNMGIWSLYLVQNIPDVNYVLLTSKQELYALGTDGGVISTLTTIPSKDQLVDVIHFDGLDLGPSIHIDYQYD